MLPHFLTARTGLDLRFQRLNAFDLEEQKHREYKESIAHLSPDDLRQIPFTEQWMLAAFPQRKKTFGDYVASNEYVYGSQEYINFRNSWIQLADRKGNKLAKSQVDEYEQQHHEHKALQARAEIPCEENAIQDGMTADLRTIFKVRTANQCLLESREQATPEPLCGNLWREGELAVLFSDSNLGKSILAVQIAQAIATGQPIEGISTCGASPQKVFYIDCELSDKQFENRYRNDEGDLFPFSDNMFRLTLDTNNYDPDDWASRFVSDIEKLILLYGVKVFVIDNITYLHNELDKGRNASPLMKELNAIKKRYGVSILALAHTPKRDLSRPITQNDLAGSKMIFNFVDSCFAIGKDANETSVRYIIQLKDRNDAIEFHDDNVLACKIEKADSFLCFVPIGNGRESEHLRTSSFSKEDLVARARELAAEGRSLRQIAAELGCSHVSVRRYLSEPAD